jgi:adenylate cyclase
MSKEIERKFLVRKDLWYAVQKPSGLTIRQGYLVSEEAKTVRIRVTDAGAFLTIKGPTRNATRDEYEFAIPADLGAEILEKLTSKRVEKIRYTLEYKGKKWDVDEFLGDNEGLIIAEIELSAETE